MTQTAGLAVTYFDRFLSKTEGGLVKQRVQLMALTCTLIAAKFSETKMPSLDDLCEVAHDKYSKAQLKEMELETLRVLHWELHAVTPHAALEQLAIIMNHTEDQSKTFLEHAEFFIDMSYYVVSSPPRTSIPSAPPTPCDTTLASIPTPASLGQTPTAKASSPISAALAGSPQQLIPRHPPSHTPPPATHTATNPQPFVSRLTAPHPAPRSIKF